MLKRDISLARFSNFQIGGPANYFALATTIKKIKEAITFAKNNNLPLFILGGGTNILFSDSGFNGLVLKPKLSYIKKINKTEFKIGAGTLISEILDFTIKNELSGLEWAGGLPGTLGGAIRGNAGCFGGEMKDNIKNVGVIKISNQSDLNFKKSKCKFGYRDSIFKNNQDYLIYEATLVFQKSDKQEIAKSIQDKIEYRDARHPMDYPNIGSIFKNVSKGSLRPSHLKKLKYLIKDKNAPVIPTARVISEAELKGVSYGGAMISPKHPNFIVNVQCASSTDVQNLIWLVKNKVKDKFGIELEEEVIVLS